MDLSERKDDHSARHPWEIARRNFFVNLLRQFGLMDSAQLLDVGSGDAWFAQSLSTVLPTSSHIMCWDPYYTDDDLARSQDGPGRVALTKVRPELKFDGILMLDVVEHVPDDHEFVSDIVRSSLADDGWVLVSVPAYQILFTEHDRQLKHYRRYSPRRMRRVLEGSGLRVMAQGGVFHSLLLPRCAQAILERVRPPVASEMGIGGWKHGPVVTGLVTAVLEAECRLSLLLGRQHRVVVPGLSYWAFCRKSKPLEH